LPGDLNRKFEYVPHCRKVCSPEDNASAHTSLKTTEFVTNNNMGIVPHPPDSPDIAPCDFAVFLKLKLKLKGLDNIKENDFHGIFEAWKKRLDRCILSQGD
jgi:hypothetical protein